MRIKKYTGKTLKEATELMKRDLGANAIVLHTRKMSSGGKLNFINKPLYEITGAIDEVPAQRETEGKNVVHPFNSYLRNSAQSTRESSVESLKRIADHFEKRSSSFGEHEHKKDLLHEKAAMESLHGEIDDIKTSLKEIAEHVKYERMPALPEQLKRSYAALMNNGVDESIAAELVQSIYARLNEEQLQDNAFTENLLLTNIAQMIRTIETPSSTDLTRRIIVLVGPTGVGKTTTIAKIAAINKIFNKLDVGIISADTYRLGAIEQMRIFADIADIPYQVVYTPTEMKTALDKFNHKQVVYIDTVGRSQKNEKELLELGEFTEVAVPDEVHLVLNASTNEKTSADIIKQFGVLQPNRLIFSKLDEAAMLGGILNISRSHSMPISYVTTGQVVPDDILVPDSNRLATMIYSGKLNG